MLLAPVDKVSIITPKNHYVEMSAMDDYKVIARSRPLHNGAIRFSVILERGFSENKTSGNTRTLGINLCDASADVLPSGHGDINWSIK